MKLLCEKMLDGDFIRWSDIREVLYIPSLPSRTHCQFTSAEISVSLPCGAEYTAKVQYFPIYALMKIKKQCPNVKIKFDKTWAAVLLLITIVLAVTAGLG